MSNSELISAHKNPSTTSPAHWDTESLQQQLMKHLDAFAGRREISIPLKRLYYQVEQSLVFQEIIRRWADNDGPQRRKAWTILTEYTEHAAREVLPICVQCSECCRKGSPTLQLEDLDLLTQGKIPWDQLICIRRGEPVRSPSRDDLSFLLDERIKIREKPESLECVFLNGDSGLCSIYVDRPVQCRAQACWDPSQARELMGQPYLTRRDIFQDVEMLLDLLAEHDKRCAFQKLQAAFERLGQTQGEEVEEVLQLLAYEDHFRHFFMEQFKIPENTADLVFGRSFAELVPVFGFRIQEEPDGGKRLVLSQT
jgi:Fe-S-cluster containining protein